MQSQDEVVSSEWVPRQFEEVIKGRTYKFIEVEPTEPQSLVPIIPYEALSGEDHEALLARPRDMDLIISIAERYGVFRDL